MVSREGGAHVCSSGAGTQSEAGPQVGQRPRVADRRLGCRTEPSNHEEPGLSDLRPLQWPRESVGPYPQGEHGGPVGQDRNLASQEPSGLTKLGRVELCRWGQAGPCEVERGLDWEWSPLGGVGEVGYQASDVAVSTLCLPLQESFWTSSSTSGSRTKAQACCSQVRHTTAARSWHSRLGLCQGLTHFASKSHCCPSQVTPSPASASLLRKL